MISIVLFSENYKIEIFELLNCLILLDCYICPFYLELANLYRNKGNLNKEKELIFKALKKRPLTGIEKRVLNKSPTPIQYP